MPKDRSLRMCCCPASEGRKAKGKAKAKGPLTVGVHLAVECNAPVLGATLRGGEVLVARGPLARPLFDRVACDAGSVSLEALDASSHLPLSSALDQTQLHAASTAIHGIAAGQPSDLSAALVGGHAAIAEAVKEALRGEGEGDTSARSASLGVVLSQAVRAGDLAVVFGKVVPNNHPLTVRSTVASLDADCVAPFLQMLAERLHAKPSTTGQALVWVRALLCMRSAQLVAGMGDEGVRVGLAKVLAAAEARIALRDSVETLLGRLDLVLARSQPVAVETAPVMSLSLFSGLSPEEEEGMEDSLEDFDEDLGFDDADLDMDVE
ncbi:hypothetical protein KIPB_009157 [Kipferlia bialata]|uniref:Uncharacterized protein n=1 Tax=Kipferlia bialata TaxID=797122 RepID=A0A391NVT9_9EUKA|nr:hypothetical protein KIPB_009157 [Kipferlia bialata]|eukprot:g9157.t1